MSLRELLRAGRPAVGAWCVLPDPFAAEVLAAQGFDWVCIDMQHGLIGDERMVDMLRALDARHTPAIVRVAWNDPAAIMRTLDAGAAGVVVPMIETPEQAAAAIGACRYPPDGYRSWGPVRAALADPGYAPARASREVVCSLMIESAEGFRRLDDILAVPGVEAVLVGPRDLALSTTGQLGDARADAGDERIAEIARACRERGVILGASAAGIEQFRAWREAGFQMVSLHSDVGWLGEGAAHALAAARREAPGP